jgi:hypothetical protein
VSNAQVGVTSVTHIPKPGQTYDTSVLSDLSSGPPDPLIARADESSDDDLDVDQDFAKYYPWEYDMYMDTDDKKAEEE